MVFAAYATVGRIVDCYASRSRPLMIIFTSDNGGYAPLADNGPLRGSKGTMYEGGIRIPLAVKWPGEVAHARSKTPVILRDLVPTILEITNSQSAGRVLDGRSLLGAADGRRLPDVPLHWHFPVYLERDSSVVGPWRTTPVAACRMGRFKLIEFFETGSLELYDLESDPNEGVNIAADHPQLVEQMHQEMQKWRSEVEAELPTPLIIDQLPLDPPASPSEEEAT